ncbi:MAG TPA: CRISPR-associated helicase Cas3' [Firmicutes bacterium]|nr:CRISPR-associated helicase Cas3' [Bacillota bacterium]
MSPSTGGTYWGKYVEETGAWLPLAAHCLDVGIVFRRLCEVRSIHRSLQETTKTRLSSILLDRLAVIAMLHDIGKVNSGFQRKILPDSTSRAGHVRELAPLFAEPDLLERFLAVLPEALHRWLPEEPYAAQSYFFAVFSHHGKPVLFDDRIRGYSMIAKKYWRASASDPFQGIAEIVNWSKVAFPDAFGSSAQRLPDEPRFHHVFAGLVMLADWIGSHPEWFPVGRTTLAERLAHGIVSADRALQNIGLDSKRLGETVRRLGTGFQDRFRLPPRPLQQAVDELDPNDPDVRLLIAESETGSGKTEAALNWFCKLFAAGKVESLYFALPTRVAARELYERVRSYISNWFPHEGQRPTVLLAVPGYAQVDGVDPKSVLASPEDANLWQDDDGARRFDRHWAAERPKRFLAATVAVGTIDQALLSIVQTGHAHLRSACLNRSLLVVDEVHASDQYMAELLRALLDHHLNVGGYALLLSATLGSAARQTFLQKSATPHVSFEDAVSAPYPALTLANGNFIPTKSHKQRSKVVSFQTKQYMFQTQQIIEDILPALRAGARVLIVLNTVGRVIDVFRDIWANPDIPREWLFQCSGQYCPHHGRYAPPDRMLLDRMVTAQFGKEAPPGPRLLVGSQTLEQSLDIDADLLITDLVPSDVLLQRVGRLHRHRRVRPSGCEQARCYVMVPDYSLEKAINQKGEPFGPVLKAGLGSVYEDLRTLERTWEIIDEYPVVEIPRDNRLLVESATHPESLQRFTSEQWQSHGQRVFGAERAKAIAAVTVTGTFDHYFGEFEFREDGVRVTTRLGADQHHVPLDRAVTSPFGQLLTEILVPSFMAPAEREELVFVEKEQDGVIYLRWSDKRYRYSVLGLEAIE